MHSCWWWRHNSWGHVKDFGGEGVREGGGSRAGAGGLGEGREGWRERGGGGKKVLVGGGGLIILNYTLHALW